MNKSKIILLFSVIFTLAGHAQNHENLFASNVDYASNFEVKSATKQLKSAGNPGNGMRPGDELVKFSRMYYTGLGVSSAGYVFMIASAATYNENLMIVGGLAVIGGYITMLASHSHIGKAGRMMNQLDDQYRREMEKYKEESSFKLNSTKDGIGVAYNF